MSEFTGKSRVLKSPTGSKLNCKGWVQEAAYRMLHNNLDPEVAERPEDLIVYGGLGKAARNWPAFDDICRALLDLNDDETLMVQSGKAVAILAYAQGRAAGVDQQFAVGTQLGKLGSFP